MLISGPVNLHILYNGKQYIYLFGDEHESIYNTCKEKDGYIYVWDLLYNLIHKNEKYFFNMFIETHQMNDDKSLIYKNIDVLYKIIEKFNCFTDNKDNCKTINNNALVHYTDYRIMNYYKYINKKYTTENKRYIQFFYLIEEIDISILEIITNIDNGTDSNKHYKNFIKCLNIMKNVFRIYSISDYIKVFKDYIYISKIDLQLRRLNREHKNTIYNELLATIKKISNKYNYINIKSLYNIINIKKVNKLSSNMFNTIIDFYMFNFTIQLILIDYYTIGRMLRSFEEMKNYEPENIYTFLYLGNKHVLIIGNILKKLNYKLIYKSKKYERLKRCIEVDDKHFNKFNLG